jgi:hypothetical protein
MMTNGACRVSSSSTTLFSFEARLRGCQIIPSAYFYTTLEYGFSSGTGSWFVTHVRDNLTLGLVSSLIHPSNIEVKF